MYVILKVLSDVKEMLSLIWEITFFRVLLALLMFVFIGIPLAFFLTIAPLLLCEITDNYWFLLIYLVYIALYLSN